MTAKQIARKLQQANIDLTGIEVRKDEVEIYLTNRAGEYSRRLTLAKAKKVCVALGWGGFSCAYGGWILQKKVLDMGDPMDKGSRWNY